MRNSRRVRIAALLFSLILLGVMFTAGYCKCTPDGGCVYVEDGSDPVACVYWPGGGQDTVCFSVGGSARGGGGGGPTSTPVATATATPVPPAVTIYKSGIYQFGYGGGIFSDDVAVTGHTITVVGGIKRVFDVNSPHSRGTETCANLLGFVTTTRVWDYFGQLYPQQSPYTLNASGTYANGALDCLGGQAIWGYAWYTWVNFANPSVNETRPNDVGYVACHALKVGFLGDFCGPFGG